METDDTDPLDQVRRCHPLPPAPQANPFLPNIFPTKFSKACKHYTQVDFPVLIKKTNFLSFFFRGGGGILTKNMYFGKLYLEEYFATFSPSLTLFRSPFRHVGICYKVEHFENRSNDPV